MPESHTGDCESTRGSDSASYWRIICNCCAICCNSSRSGCRWRWACRASRWWRHWVAGARSGWPGVSRWRPLRCCTARASCVRTMWRLPWMRCELPAPSDRGVEVGRAYFRTDGIRGRVGADPMTVDFALRLASAAARVVLGDGGTVLIGKDTRVSGYMFEAALEAGFVAAGANVLLTGPLPTPAVAYMTRHLRCRLGVVISASHNVYEDNGIKFFDGEGAKLSDQLEERIEAQLSTVPLTCASRELGRARRVDSALLHYQEFCGGVLA